MGSIPESPGVFVGGSPDVFIGGKPAWRAGKDEHKCSQATGNVPHVGGGVVEGSETVFINNFPAVRQGDVIVETGPSNEITGGCPTVLIG